MQIESADQAEAYIDEHGENAVREKIAAGMLGNEKRALAFLDAEFARRAGNQAMVNATRAAERAASNSARAARWTMVAGFAALLAALLQLGQFALPLQRSSWEQLAQCRIDASRDLASTTSGNANEDSITRGDYLSECMLASGFEFQSDVGQRCQTHDDVHEAVKRVIPSCYQRRSLISRWRTTWEGSL